MSETARKLFEGLKIVKDAALLKGGEIASELVPEVTRLGTQGQMELASAIFSGNGFVPYGPGQYTPSPERPQQEQQQDRGLER